MKNLMGLHRGGIGCTFQGQFPVKESGEDGFAGIASMDWPLLAAHKAATGFLTASECVQKKSTRRKSL